MLPRRAGNTSSSSSSSSPLPPLPPPRSNKGISDLAPIQEDEEEEEPSEEEGGDIKERPLPSRNSRLPALYIRRQGHNPLLLDEDKLIHSKASQLMGDKKMGIRAQLGTVNTSILSYPSNSAGKGIRKRLPSPLSLPIPKPEMEGWVDSSIMSNLNDSAGKAIRKRLLLPTIGDKEPLSELAAEYSSDNYIIQEKIKLLEEKYSSFRRTRRDGNCFYRSFLFSYLEHIVEMQDVEEVDRIVDRLELYKMDCADKGQLFITLFDFPAISSVQYKDIKENWKSGINSPCSASGAFPKLLVAFYAFHELMTFSSKDFHSLLREIPEGKVTNIMFTHEELLDRSLDEQESSSSENCRCVFTSLEICKREDFYKPFLGVMKQQRINEYCLQEVFPMGIEVDHVHIIALCNALRIPIRLENLDTSLFSGAVRLNHHDFIPESFSNSFRASDTLASFSRKFSSSASTSISAMDPPKFTNTGKVHATLPGSGSTERSGTSTNTSNISSSDQQVPYVILLYRPGHYDILYPK